MGEYVPVIGQKLNKLPGMGGVYNIINLHAFAYTNNNPMNLTDPDGREPNRRYMGTSAEFKTVLDNSPRQVGKFKGEQASNYLKNLSNTEFSQSQLRPVPTETAYFNTKKGRYIYTEKGGWIDMVHFLFYAGEAYKNKLAGKKDPVGNAIKNGHNQEWSDAIVAPYSAYSYEDLPSDRFGAEFGANYFDPNSDLTFGEQVENYLNNILNATVPENAPNYNKLPSDEPGKKDKPSRINWTTTPVYTKDNP